MVVNGDEMDAGADVAHLQFVNKLRPIDTQRFEIEQDGVEMPHMGAIAGQVQGGTGSGNPCRRRRE
jgi:hypothetical protein